MHRHRRWTVMALLATLLLTSGLMALRSARTEPVTAIVHTPDWQSKTWFRLDLDTAESLCELPGGARYRLVIGCLADAAQSRSVRVALTEHSPVSEQARRASNVWAMPAPTDRRHVRRGPHIRPSVPSSPAPSGSLVQPLGQCREFYLHVTDGDLDDPKQYARIVARTVACGQRVRIFLDQQLPVGEVPPARIDELLQALESDVVPRVEGRFGELQDVDGDGRFAVVLTPWLSRLQGGRTSIGGMVRSSDFRSDVPAPLSNHGDMLFLNSRLPRLSALRDLLSHEVAHAACVCQRRLNSERNVPEEEDWLSEALAHLAEPGWSNLDYRLAAYLNDPSQYPLVVADYYRAGLWRNPGCRGATFLFTRWCSERHGDDFVRRLIESPSRGTQNVASVMGRRFDDLFRDWNLALASDGGLDDLQTVLTRGGFAGLRPAAFRGDIPAEQAFQVRGTAFQVVDLRLSPGAPRTLRISGDPSARWQFTICQIPNEPLSTDENVTCHPAAGLPPARELARGLD